jgi:hypothetical protein
MNTSFSRDVTPVIDTLQLKIAFLRKGISPNRWAKAHGYSQPTTWRVVNNHPAATGPIARKIRQELIAFIKEQQS